ncbi:NAD-dependent epimerase/dehydratase family protein [Mycobacterium sp. SMC-2]|uniref:NAD-dependent epimerase/dehydratase family protein n=1 Tax=Mycobacterium sp. SMC-2 TaxID=2857058 RepID=UPI0021B4C68F|nr:NAD-dependent epimerase/dehydratase family protein [Mycobacterium sp. SMC-2]UXA07194.1 NAD-dependent epimerase/dehydratase family protein [Mycobacterium sp. SMC-2]
MRIAVTGGTGYLGAHMVRALLQSGHQVRLLVAPDDPATVVERLRTLGPLTVVVGDVRAAATISELLGGVEAVVHAAGVVGTDERRAQAMWDINAFAAESIMARAVDIGLDPVVLVSSYSALFPPPDGVISPDSPTAPGRSAYAKTKGYADRVARRLQEAGAPIVVTFPSSVVGSPFGTPPGVTERGWAPIVRWRVAPKLNGGMQMIDVRDVADVHVRIMEPGRGPRRYVCGGQMIAFNAMIDALEEGLGRRVRRIPMSPSVFRAMGRLADVLGHYVPLGDGLGYEAALLLTAAVPTDDSKTLRELGISWRSPVAAIVESLRAGPW